MSETQNLDDSNELKAKLLVAEDINLAASLLFISYHDDPVFLDIFKHTKPDYDKRLRGAIREELSTFWNTQQPMVGLFSGEHLLGVACLIEPQKELEPERFWHWRLKMMLNAGILSTKNMIEKEKLVAAAIPNAHYHLLTFIAIHPDHQHQGLGHYLIKAVDTIINENTITEGVAVFVTQKKNQMIFNDGNYEKLDSINIGSITGTLMFKKI